MKFQVQSQPLVIKPFPATMWTLRLSFKIQLSQSEKMYYLTVSIWKGFHSKKSKISSWFYYKQIIILKSAKLYFPFSFLATLSVTEKFEVSADWYLRQRIDSHSINEVCLLIEIYWSFDPELFVYSMRVSLSIKQNNLFRKDQTQVTLLGLISDAVGWTDLNSVRPSEESLFELNGQWVVKSLKKASME